MVSATQKPPRETTTECREFFASMPGDFGLPTVTNSVWTMTDSVLIIVFEASTRRPTSPKVHDQRG
jgi:hypothetical protein